VFASIGAASRFSSVVTVTTQLALTLREKILDRFPAKIAVLFG
jgi:hypothetical protein